MSVPTLFQLAANCVPSSQLGVLPDHILQQCQAIWSYTGKPIIGAFGHVVYMDEIVSVKAIRENHNGRLVIWQWTGTQCGDERIVQQFRDAQYSRDIVSGECATSRWGSIRKKTDPVPKWHLDRVSGSAFDFTFQK